jgi:hypothetical protein
MRALTLLLLPDLAQGRLGGSSEDGYELEGASEGEVGADLEDGLDREDDVADIMGACAPFAPGPACSVHACFNQAM